MARSSLADMLKGALEDHVFVARATFGSSSPGRGKKRVRITTGDKLLVFRVTQPDFPRREIHVVTEKPDQVKNFAYEFLTGEGVAVVHR